MAKKNLINADMLLATPRKVNEPSLSMAEEPFKVTIHEIIDLPTDAPPTPEGSAAVSSVKRGLKGHETRATFIVEEALLDKLKAIAYWDRLNIKDVINDSFRYYLDAYETQNGEVNPIPASKKG
ncbi:MAG: hypothetical protein JNL70_04325 [Saprospiraceae bacterium]|nr:hypothetical protein [Saprospiraceae bacterium]